MTVEVQVVVRPEDRQQGAVDDRVIQQVPQLRHHRQDVVVARAQLPVERFEARAHVIVVRPRKRRLQGDVPLADEALHLFVHEEDGCVTHRVRPRLLVPEGL